MDELTDTDLAMADFRDELPEEHAEVYADLRSVFLEAPADEVMRDHLDAMLAAVPTAPAVPIARSRRRRAIVASAVGMSAALAVGGGLAAATGNLPGPLRDVVAGLVAPFGIDLPDGDSTGATSPSDPDGVTTPVSENDQTDQSNGTSDPDGPPPSTGPSGIDELDLPDPNAPPLGQPGSPEVPSGPAEQPGNRPDIPPGQSEQPGNRPDVPPGQAGENGNKPDSPPGQSGPQGNQQGAHPQQSQGQGGGNGTSPAIPPDQL